MSDLSQIEAFSHFSAQQLDLLQDCASRTRYPPGTLLVKEGDSSLEAYVIQSGTVRLQRETSYGQFALAALGPGAMFGEISFVDRDVRSVDAMAETEVDVLVLNPVALSTLIERDHAFTVALYWAFWKSLSAKLRDTNERLAHFFSDGPASGPAPPPSLREPSGEFKLDIEAKRAVFREQRLSNMEINFLASLSKAKKYKPNDVIFQEGDQGDRMFIILEGRVMISKVIPGAGEEALAFLGRGDFFGEMALIDQQPRSADAKADAGGAVCLAIQRDVLEKILDIHKVSSIRLLKVLCALVAKRLREVNEKIIGWYILSGGQQTTHGAQQPQ